MKRLIAIFLFFVAITTATFAGTGLTATVQGRALTVEVVDNNVYNVTVLSDTKRLTSTQISHKSGTFIIDMPEGNDNFQVIITNIKTGVVEIIPFLVK